LFGVEDFKDLNECPTSYVSAQSKQLLSQMNIISFAREATGTTWHGADLALWPASDVEIAIALESEKNRLANSRHKAQMIHSQKPLVTLADH
jgi:hypothetical protein